MRLNEYIFKKFMDMSDPDTMSDYFTEDNIEKWIVDWYNASFEDRLPPLWLANWRRE